MDCSPQTPLSMGFPRQEYWSGWPYPPPGELPDPGIEPTSLISSALAGGFFTTAPPGKWRQMFSFTGARIPSLTASPSQLCLLPPSKGRTGYDSRELAPLGSMQKDICPWPRTSGRHSVTRQGHLPLREGGSDTPPSLPPLWPGCRRASGLCVAQVRPGSGERPTEPAPPAGPGKEGAWRECHVL